MPRTLHALAFLLGFQVILVVVGQTMDTLVQGLMTAAFGYGVGLILLGPFVLALNVGQALAAGVVLALLLGLVRGRVERTSHRGLAWAAVSVTMIAGFLVVLPVVTVWVGAMQNWASFLGGLVAGWEQWLSVGMLLPVAVLARSEEPPTTQAAVDRWIAAGAALGVTLAGSVVPFAMAAYALRDPSVVTEPVQAGTTWMARAAAVLPGLLALVAVAAFRTPEHRVRVTVLLAVAMGVSVPGYFLVVAWPTSLAAALATGIAVLAARSALEEAREAES